MIGPSARPVSPRGNASSLLDCHARTSAPQDSGATRAPEPWAYSAALKRTNGSGGGQRRLLPRGEHEQQPGPQAGQGRAYQQLAAFVGQLNLLCLWYRTAGPSLRKRRENQADQRSRGGQRRLLPRGEHEQQPGPQAGQGRAYQQLAAFVGQLNRHQRHDRPMRDTGPDGVRDQAAICGGVACREHQENAEDPAPPERPAARVLA